MTPCRHIAVWNALALMMISGAAFPAVQQPVDELEEVIVHGNELDVLRKEMIKTEDQFFDRYNELVGKRDYQVHCSVEQPIGSRVPRRYCRTGYEQEALAQAGREMGGMMQNFLNDVRMNVPPAAQSQQFSTTSVSPASLDGKHEAFKKYMRETVTHDEILLKALVNHARLMDRYNTVHREKFGARSRR